MHYACGHVLLPASLLLAGAESFCGHFWLCVAWLGPLWGVQGTAEGGHWG